MTAHKSDNSGRIAALLPAVLWLIWIGVFLWLLYGGRYRAFLQPKFWPLPVIGLLVFGLFLAVFVHQYWRHPSGGRRRRRWLDIGVLVVPAIYVYVVYGHSLGADALASRATGTVFSLEDYAERYPEPRYEPGREVLLSTLTMKPTAFIGKSITVEGGVYRDQNVPESYFLMYRFFIFCCAADAIPLWVVVHSPRSGLLETETWVRVTGRFSLETINNNTVPMLRADALEKIPPPPPELRYLYF
jgi:uncharacterized repeat protein (TIGR03943 family)